jgi:hypothetical protein
MDRKDCIKNIFEAGELIENSVVAKFATTAKDGKKYNANYYNLVSSQKSMAQTFGVNVRTISEHLQNIFKMKELDENSVFRKIQKTAFDGKKYNTKFYNLFSKRENIIKRHFNS